MFENLLVLNALIVLGKSNIYSLTVRELAKVVFPYKGEHEDELDLQEGDVIIVICKDLEDKGWWKGELSGKVGVFPDNFVELITTEESVSVDFLCEIL